MEQEERTTLVSQSQVEEYLSLTKKNKFLNLFLFLLLQTKRGEPGAGEHPAAPRGELHLYGRQRGGARGGGGDGGRGFM